MVGFSGDSDPVADVTGGWVVPEPVLPGPSCDGVVVIGQTVVEIGIVSVTMVVVPSVQLGLSGPQSVTVRVEVEKMVEVVKLSDG